jgi:hypothetical protein
MLAFELIVIIIEVRVVSGAESDFYVEMSGD